MPAFPENADAVLARMDNESSNFHQITAKLTKSDYTAVLNDAQSESGQMWLRRNGSDIVMRTDFAAPQSRSVAVGRGTAQIYYPKINTVQIYDLGKAGVLVDQFLVLGFGSSGKDISKNYVGEAGWRGNGERQKRRAGSNSLPNRRRSLSRSSKVELWIPLNAGHPVQQRVTQPGRRLLPVHLLRYQAEPGSCRKAHSGSSLPADVKKEYPQK